MDRFHQSSAQRRLLLIADLEALRRLKHQVHAFTRAAAAEPVWAPETLATPADFRRGEAIGAAHSCIAGATIGRIADEAFGWQGAGVFIGVLAGPILGMAYGHSKIRRGWRTCRSSRKKLSR